LLNSSVDSTGAPKCCFRPRSNIHSCMCERGWINRWI